MMLYALIGVVWGLVINQLACLLVCEYAPISLTSHCHTCKHTFLWYQRIPLFSYVLLAGRCPHCSSWIPLYHDSTVFLAVCSLYALSCYVDPNYFYAYMLFFTALLITFRTDIETMLISHAVTVYLIPGALVMSALRLLPISPFESMLGTVFGYLLLYGIMHLFVWVIKKQGMGWGDVNLLSFIGSCTGPMGCWVALLVGSLLGSLIGIILLTVGKRNTQSPLPFGPFLALGAMVYVLWQQDIVSCLFQTHL